MTRVSVSQMLNALVDLGRTYLDRPPADGGVDALVDDLKAVGHTPAETTAWLEANETAIKALAEDDYALLMDRVDVKTGEPQHEGN